LFILVLVLSAMRLDAMKVRKNHTGSDFVVDTNGIDKKVTPG